MAPGGLVDRTPTIYQETIIMADKMQAGADAPAAIGHNSGTLPLEEQLKLETVEIVARTESLVASAEAAVVIDEASKAEAVSLAKMLGDQVKAIEDAHEIRKAPFWSAGKMVDAAFKPLIDKAKAARQRVITMIDEARRRQEAEAEAERKRLRAVAEAERARAEESERAKKKAVDDVARIQRESAERIAKAEAEARESNSVAARETAARIRAEEEVKAARGTTLARQEASAAEAAQMASLGRAGELERTADRTGPAVVDSGRGVKAHGRVVNVHEIIDAVAFVKWMMKSNPEKTKAALHDLAKPLIGKIAAIPGVRVTQDTKTTIR